MASASSRELQSDIDNIERLNSLNNAFKETLTSLKKSYKEDQQVVFEKPLEHLTNESKKLNDSLKSKKDSLKNINSLKTSHSFSYNLPAFGTSTDLKPDSVLTFCSPFSGHSSESFETFYRKVLLFSENNNLTENAFKQLLGGLLKGGAFDLYYSIRSETTESIIKSLASRYSDHKTLFQYANELRNLTRRENESITSVMGRVDYYLEKTKNLCEPSEQSARHKLALTEQLYKHCTDKAKQKLIERRYELSRQGIIMSYSEMLELVSLTESSDVPLPHFTINTSTTEPLATPAYVEKRREHRLRSNSPYRIPREKASNPFTPQKFEPPPSDSSQPNFDPTKFSNPPARSRSPPFVPPPSPPIERKSILKGSNHHSDFGEPNQSSTSYNQRHRFDARNRSYSPPSSFNERGYYNGNGRRSYTPYYNNMAADDLKLLINRLTDIFNIINRPNPRNFKKYN